MIAKRIACALAGLALCSMTLCGCSGDQEKKEEKKTMTVQEQMGKEATEALKKPMDEARKAAAQVEAKADQALKETAEGAKKAIQDSGVLPAQSGKEKKKLEGC